MTSFERLQQWYYSHCNGDWEHSFGIRINTIDNPGWRADINLEKTLLENKAFTLVKCERTEHDWYHAFVEDKIFKIACGPKNFDEALSVFCDWAGIKK